MGGRTIQPLKFGDQIIYIEVSEVDQQGRGSGDEDRFEHVGALDEVKEAGSKVLATIQALSTTVQSALENARPDEWSLEINLGFKGRAGIPFITEGEANGAVKVIAKWTRPDE